MAPRLSICLHPILTVRMGIHTDQRGTRPPLWGILHLQLLVGIDAGGNHRYRSFFSFPSFPTVIHHRELSTPTGTIPFSTNPCHIGNRKKKINKKAKRCFPYTTFGRFPTDINPNPKHHPIALSRLYTHTPQKTSRTTDSKKVVVEKRILYSTHKKRGGSSVFEYTVVRKITTNNDESLFRYQDGL